MPLYEYECKECDNKFEELNKVEERDLTVCPRCKGEVRRLITRKVSRDWFRPHWNEDFDVKPVYVESKEHYKKLCKQYGVQARCLM